MCGAAAGDDVVQETFLSVLRTGRFDASKGTVAAYLFGIARHHVIKRLGIPNKLLMEACGPRALNMVALQDTPFETVAREQAVAAVRTAVESLPPLYREVIVLCDLQEMEYAVVADVIGCPIGTVRSRLHRARALLASKLELHIRRRTFGT